MFPKVFGPRSGCHSLDTGHRNFGCEVNSLTAHRVTCSQKSKAHHACCSRTQNLTSRVSCKCRAHFSFLFAREQSSKFAFSREQIAQLVFSRAGKAHCSRFLAQVKIFLSSLWSGWSIEEMVKKECTGRCAPFTKNCEIATLCVLFRLKPAITIFSA